MQEAAIFHVFWKSLIYCRFYQDSVEQPSLFFPTIALFLHKICFSLKFLHNIEQMLEIHSPICLPSCSTLRKTLHNKNLQCLKSALDFCWPLLCSDLWMMWGIHNIDVKARENWHKTCITIILHNPGQVCKNWPCHSLLNCTTEMLQQSLSDGGSSKDWPVSKYPAELPEYLPAVAIAMSINNQGGTIKISPFLSCCANGSVMIPIWLPRGTRFLECRTFSFVFCFQQGFC